MPRDHAHYRRLQQIVLSLLASLALTPQVMAGSFEVAFTPVGPPLQPGSAVRGIAWADVTGDQRPDFVTANNLDLSLFVNTGGKGLSLAPPVQFGSGAGQLRDLMVLDLNGDGLNDLVLAQRQGTGMLRVQYNAGNGQFGPPQVYGFTGNAWALRLADVDLDGDMDAIIIYDVFVSGTNSTFVALYKNLGAGVFDSPQSLHVVNAPITYVADVAVRDIDNDGAPDILALHGNAHLIVKFINNGDGTFGPKQVVNIGNIVPVGIEVADLNNDGFPDLICVNETPGALLVSYNNGTGQFASPLAFPAESNSSFTHFERPAVADFNHDGWLDMAFAGSVYLNQSGQGFSNAIVIDQANTGTHINAAPDLDGDGRADLLFVRFGLTSPTTLLLNQPQPVVVGDINGDGVVGVPDLLAVIANWGACGGTCPPSPGSCPADIAPQPTGDCSVGVPDLLMVIANWG